MNPAWTPTLTAYTLLGMAGLGLTILLWRRRVGEDQRLAVIYVGGLVGAMVGAKVGFWLAELPFHAGEPDFWRQALVGRTVLGALLGGYGGVEAGKMLVGYRAPTGDLFALVVPIGLALGRLGCRLQGCCRGTVCPASWWTVTDAAGVARWPAQSVEMGFQVLAAIVLWALRRRGRFPGQLFHLYLMAYGLFRFLHEALRDSPVLWRPDTAWLPPVTTYQPLALLLLAFGAWRYLVRRSEESRKPARLGSF